MTDVERYFAFVLAAVVIIVIPGPSVLFVVGRALAHGRAVALASVVGNTVGSASVLVLVALGLGRLVQESAAAFTVLKIVGAGYLVYLGIQAIRHRRDLETTHVTGTGQGLGAVAAARQGVLVGVSNPKVYVMFAALLPQFIAPAGAVAVPVQMLVLGAVVLVIGLVSDAVWALGAARLRSALTSSPRRTRAVATAGGVSMVGLGVWMAASGRP